VWMPRETGFASDGYDAVQIADMDGDGQADVVAFGAGLLSVFRGDGAGNWNKVVSFVTPGVNSKSFEALRAGVDFDHNGFPDFALVQDEGGLFNSNNKLRVFREGSVPSQLFARVVSPGAGRVWRGGQVRFLDWAAGVPGAAPGAVTLELSTTGPGGPWSLLAANLPDNGRHQLVVPTGINSTACRIRLTLTAGAGSVSVVSKGSFSILP